ncbi:MAG: Rid family hydrolase [Anaerolineales bacterium]
MTNLQEFATMNEVYGGVFALEPPARSTIQVAALPGGASVKIEAIAWAEGG